MSSFSPFQKSGRDGVHGISTFLWNTVPLNIFQATSAKKLISFYLLNRP